MTLMAWAYEWFAVCSIAWLGLCVIVGARCEISSGSCGVQYDITDFAHLRSDLIGCKVLRVEKNFGELDHVEDGNVQRKKVGLAVLSGGLSQNLPVLNGGLQAKLSKMPSLIAGLSDPSNCNGCCCREESSDPGGPNDGGDSIDLHVFIWICVGIGFGAGAGSAVGLLFARWRKWI